jgi:hypothetical protein
VRAAPASRQPNDCQEDCGPSAPSLLTDFIPARLTKNDWAHDRIPSCEK